jgi:hypothetical protein
MLTAVIFSEASAGKARRATNIAARNLTMQPFHKRVLYSSRKEEGSLEKTFSHRSTQIILFSGGAAGPVESGMRPR